MKSEELSYLDVMTRRNWVTRMWAAAIALAMNLALFAMMPFLLHRDSAPPAYEEMISQINVIRIKRPDSAVHRKSAKTPEVAPKQDPLTPQPVVQQPVMTKLSLPFEINPRLPAGPTTLNLPPMKPADIDALDVKEPFEAADLDSPMTPLGRVPPVYPMSAKRRGIQGWVKVRILVNELGNVEQVSIEGAKPAGVFDQSVMDCVSSWRFKPGTVEGRPVRAWAETTVRFELE
ncbi:MAG: TonB family protein [Desulfobacterales bacterium]|nr:TonB family protein [Desulfobacterales bacterium]